MIWQKWPLCKKSVGDRNLWLFGLKKETITQGSFIVLLILIEDNFLACALMEMSFPR
jgi:hypothetical protein